MLLDFAEIKTKYNLNIKGIIHVGAHYGEELFDYINNGIKKILLFEPIQDNYNILEKRINDLDAEIKLYKIALGSEIKNVSMYVSDNDKQSSSILKPKKHLTQHPDVYFPDIENVEVDILDNYDTSNYNFISMDVQGYELEVLKGAKNSLKNIDYVYCEVNRDEVYENNALVEELDLYLSQYGFKRVETIWSGEIWGDALYIKDYNVSSSCQISNLNQIYRKYFGYPSNGVFVEIGAYDGESFSNTSCLADHGWKGLYIEPIKEYCEYCAQRHVNNNVKIINCSVGSIEGEINFYKNGALSTSNQRQIDIYNTLNWAKKDQFINCKINQYRLENILFDQNIYPNFDILVVDVEGNEEDIFNSFNLNFWAPKMLIVELIDNHIEFKQFDNFTNKCKILRNKIIESNYSEIYSDNINSIFINKNFI